MHGNLAIQSISQLFALCGLVSIRMFLPAFVYFFIMRLSLEGYSCLSKFSEMAHKIPEWQISTPFLTILGGLAILEIIALRVPEIKEFLVEDFDKYAKPIMTLLISVSIISSKQANELQEIIQVQQASFGDFFYYILAVIGSGITYAVCCLRKTILSFVNMIDPDNSLKIQTVFNWLGEMWVVLTLIVIIFLPTAVIILIAIQAVISWYFSKKLQRHIKQHSHICLRCKDLGRETMISDSSLICPICADKQENVYHINFLGFTTKKLLNPQDETKHCAELLSFRRCRWCATPLKKNTFNWLTRLFKGKDKAQHICCEHQWDEQMLNYYLKWVDKHLPICLLLGLLPGAALITFPFVLRKFNVHLNMRGRFISYFFKKCIKIILLITAAFPFINLIPLGLLVIWYLHVRKKFINEITAQINQKKIEKLPLMR